MKSKSLGQELVTAVDEALASKEKGRLVRPAINVTAIRQSQGLTQKQFSETYHIKLQTLRNWEQGKRMPDTATFAYLICIAKRPIQMKKILKECFK